MLSAGLSGRFHVVPKNTGDEAVEYCKESKYISFILLGIGSDEKEWFETLKELRSLDAYKVTPIVAYVEEDLDEATKKSYLQAGFTDFWIKDLKDRGNRNKLVQGIEAVIKNHQSSILK